MSAQPPGGLPRPRLYDTLTRETPALEPMDGRTFRFYCCGPTVYGPAHIGNFRTFVMQDVFRRVLEVSGIPTRHVRNITDVDDKTIRQSQTEGKTLDAFCQEWTEKFQRDAAALHLLPPHVEAGAVSHLPDQIALIGRLMADGHAYQGGDGSVYFRIGSFPAYGALSRLQERTLTTHSTQADDEYDRDSAADFALWKAHRPEDGANFWPSPWGDGRPGWHVECSAMAMKHLGESFDLHGGGMDLIFPHHENEIAQSEAATGKPFARHWFHVAHLMVEGRKMSKSLGNLHTLEDVLDHGFSAEELRYVLLAGHYRQPLNFTWDALPAARKFLGRLRILRERLGVPGPTPDHQPLHGVFTALADDLNTPAALGQLSIATKEINAWLESDAPSPDARAAVAASFADVLRMFGFLLPAPSPLETPAAVTALAEERWQARQNRDWVAADRLRAQLEEAGWRMRDGRDSYTLAPFDNPAQ